MKTFTSIIAMVAISTSLQAGTFEQTAESDDTIQVQEVLVLGAVQKGGFYPIKQGEPMRLKTAIALAGGLTSEAKESAISILRPDANGKYSKLEPASLSVGEDNEPQLQTGDIVYVPTSEESLAGRPE